MKNERYKRFYLELVDDGSLISINETSFQKSKYYIRIMVIISKAVLQVFPNLHPDSKTPLDDWYKLVKNAGWKNFNEMRNTFNSVDAVGNDRYVFNIKGNSYRLVALIIFKVRTVFILFIGTHKEYDKINASKVAFRK